MTCQRNGVMVNPYHYLYSRCRLIKIRLLLIFVVAAGCLKGSVLAATLNQPPTPSAASTAAACAPLPAPANGIVAYSTPLGGGGGGGARQQFAPPGTLARTACLAGYELIIPAALSTSSNVARITSQCTSSGQWNSSLNAAADGSGQAQLPRCSLNIALGMPTLMSSTASQNTSAAGMSDAHQQSHPYETPTAAAASGGGGAWLAVDGSLAFCAKSQLERQPWWQVQLDRPYAIALIKVTLGGEMTENQSVEILLTNTSYATAATTPVASISCTVTRAVAAVPSSRQHIHMQALYADCGGTSLQTGQFIVVRSTAPAAVAVPELSTSAAQQRLLLHLCEVEVFSDEARTCSHPGNPRNGLVKLSSDSWPYVPGTQAVYECDEGYTRLPFNSAHFHRRCQPNGDWTEQQPTCEMDVALYKYARQGSNFSSNAYPAWHAVDGDPTTCSWTRRESSPWLLIDLLDSYEIKALAVLLDKERLFYDFHRKNLELAFFNTTSDLAINAALAYANADETARRNIRRLAGTRQNRATTTYAPLFLTAADIGYEFLEFAQIDLNSQGSGIFVMQRPVSARSVLITPSSFGGSSSSGQSPSSLSPKYLGVCDIKIYTSSAVPPVASRCGTLNEHGASSAFLYTRSNTASSSCLQVERYHQASWDGAQHACAARGGSLLKHIDRAAQAHVGLVLDHLYRFHDTADAYWIGARRRNAQQQQQQTEQGESAAPAHNALVNAQPWQWVDNGHGNLSTHTILPNDFTFWSQAISNDAAASETTTTNANGQQASEAAQCAAMGGESVSDWSWTNYRCSREANWICEYPVRGCSSPQLPPGVLIDRTFYEYLETGKWESGDELQLVCEPGHIAKAERNLKCEPNGLWSGVAECRRVDCGPPPTIPNTNILLLNGTTTYNSKAHYFCVAAAPTDGQILPSFSGASAVVSCTELGWQSITLSCSNNDDGNLIGRATDADFSEGFGGEAVVAQPALPKSNISQQQPSFMFADPNELSNGPNFISIANTPPSWLPPRVEMKTVTPLPMYTRHIITSTAAMTSPTAADDAAVAFPGDDTTSSSSTDAVIPTSNNNRQIPDPQQVSIPPSGGGLSVGGGIAIGFGTALLLMLLIAGLIWQFARQTIADKFGIFITGPVIGGSNSDTSSDRHAGSSNHHSSTTAADSISHQQQFHLNQHGIVASTTPAHGKTAFLLAAPPLTYHQQPQHYIVNDNIVTASPPHYASAVMMLSNDPNQQNHMGTIRLTRNVVVADDSFANNAQESHYYASHTYATAAAALATAQQQQQQQQFDDDESSEQRPVNSFSDGDSSGSSSPRQAASNAVSHQRHINGTITNVQPSEYVSTTLCRRQISTAQPPPPPPMPPLPSVQLSTPSSQHTAFMQPYRDSAYNSSLSGESVTGSHHHRHLQLTPLSYSSHYDIVGNNLRPQVTAVATISRKPSSLLSSGSAGVSAGRKPLAGGVPVLPQIVRTNSNSNTGNTQQYQHSLSGSGIIHAFGGNAANAEAITANPAPSGPAGGGTRKLSKPYQRPQAYHTTKERRSNNASFGNSSSFWSSPSTTNVNDDFTKASSMLKQTTRAALMSNIGGSASNGAGTNRQPQYVKTLGRTAMKNLVRKAARALSTSTSDAGNSSPVTTSLSVADLFSAASNGNPQTNPNGGGNGGGGPRCRTPGSAQNLRLMPMISGPIECRKTVLINGGTPHAMPTSQVIYASDIHQSGFSTPGYDEARRHRTNSTGVERNSGNQQQQNGVGDSDFADSLIYDCLSNAKDSEDVFSQYENDETKASDNGSKRQQSDAISSATTISTGRTPTGNLHGSTPGVSEKSLTTSFMEELQRRIKNSSLDDLSPTMNAKANNNTGRSTQYKTLNPSKIKPLRQTIETNFSLADAVNNKAQKPQDSARLSAGGTLPKTGGAGYESGGCYFDDEFEEEIYGTGQRGASLSREQAAAAYQQQQRTSNILSPGFATSRQNPVFVTPYMTAYDLKPSLHSNA